MLCFVDCSFRPVETLLTIFLEASSFLVANGLERGNSGTDAGLGDSVAPICCVPSRAGLIVSTSLILLAGRWRKPRSDWKDGGFGALWLRNQIISISVHPAFAVQYSYESTFVSMVPAWGDFARL